ncbi:MAG TPA: NADPH-dependent F420 reductase [Woeseiaceae bacterium]|nr:NADPH-dependent F420 reductase [Woeseiaceae bacterium]
MKTLAAAFFLFIGCVSPTLADTIAIIGTGNVAKALGPEFAALGHTIVYGSRSPDSEKTQDLVSGTPGQASAALPSRAIVDADIVVLAVPGLLVEEITRDLGDLSGKIIIDPTNPLVGDWDTEMELGVDSSNTQIIQNVAPSAFVVKAFSTLNWRQMVEPGGAISIPIAGDSDAAKQRVAELISGMGLEPMDLGPVKNAHWIEGMTIVWLNNRKSDRPDFEYHLRRID